METGNDNFWERQQQTTENIQQQRLENRDIYGINLPDNAYQFLNQIISVAENPEEEAYRIGLAYKYAEGFGVSFDEAYNNVDAYNQTWWENEKKSNKEWYKAVADSFTMGNNNVRIGQLGNDIRNSELDNDTEAVELYYKEYETLRKQNEALYDSVPRNWIVEALKAGAESAPFTGYTALAGLFGNLLSPAAGGFAAWETSSSLIAGQEYLSLREEGADPETAAKVSALSGAVQGVVEAALGDVAGFIGAGTKAVAGKAASKTTEKIVNGIAKRFHFGGGARLATRLATEYGKEVAGEGLEEGVQELVSIVAHDIAAELGEYEIPEQTAADIVKRVTDAVKGGMLGSVILSGLPLAVNTVTTVKDYTTVRRQAREIDSEEAFINTVKDSPAFSPFKEGEKEKVIRGVWRSYQSQRDERFDRQVREQAEVTSAAEGMEENTVDADTGEITPGESEYRDAEGRLWTQNDQTENGGVFKAGTPEKESGNLYGYIDYTINENENTVEINEFKMNASRENLRGEFYDRFAESFAGYDIQWNPKGSVAQGIKRQLESRNISGRGLNYYASQETVSDTRTRTKVAAELRRYMPKLDDSQRASAVALLESMAQGQGKSISSYVRETFGSSIFGDVSEVEALAQAQGSTFQGKAGATTWKRFGENVRAVIYAGEKADFSTWSHELAHVYQSQLQGDIKTQAETAFNVKDGDWINSTYTFDDGRTMSSAEAFAYGFQDWLETGKAPSAEMRNIFRKFAEFLSRCYNALKNHLNLSPEIISTYERLLKGDDSMLAEAEEAVRRQNREYKAQERQREEESRREQQRSEEQEAFEAGETTITEDSREEESLPVESAEEADVTEERTNETRLSLNNIPGPQAEEIVRTITDKDATVSERDAAIIEGSASEREGEIILYQLAGLKGIRQIAREERRQTLLENYMQALNLEEKFTKQGLAENVRMVRIKKATGWDKNASGEWVYETDDSLARLKNVPALKTIIARNLTNKNMPVIVSDILYDPELFEIYPWMKNVNVQFFDDIFGARSSIGENGITINTRYINFLEGAEGLKGTLLHEIQHIIQAYENSSSTGIEFKQIKQLWDSMHALARREMTAANIGRMESVINDYINNPGEIDARNVARRVMMKAQERVYNPLRTTQDVQTLLFQDTESIEEVRSQYIGTDKWLKAPNGQETNLTERQWLQVRTPEFKEWFGDWENETEIENGNVSFFTDENGEPKMFYHGSKAKESFDIFDIEQFGKNDAGWMGEGFYFSGEFAVAAGYNSGNIPLFEVFLNSKEPYFMSDEEHDNLVESDDINTSREFSDNLKEDGYDGVWFNGDLNQEAVVFNPNQIKSATDNAGTFDPRNPSILFQQAYHGSPHNFDSFSTDAIGSGEGRQVFGWGLYFTDNRGIAEGYAKKLTKPKVRYKGEDTETAKRRAKDLRTAEEIEAGEKSTEEITLGFIERMARNKASGLISDYKENIKELIKVRENSLEGKAYPPNETEKRIYRKQIEALQNIDPEQIEVFPVPLNLYTVDIPDGDYIKWDEKLTEGQKRKITEQARKEGITDGWGNPFAYEMDGEWVLNSGASSSGEIFYRMEMQGYFPDDKAKSLFLARAGIKGIDYPAGSLSGGAEGRNFVVFDDRDVQVQEHILFQMEAIDDEQLREAISSVPHTEARKQYIKEIYENQKNGYETREFVSRDGKRKGNLEVYKQRSFKGKEHEIDEALFFASKGIDVTLLTEGTEVGGKYVDALFNHETLVEFKRITGATANGVANNIKDAANKMNSEVITVFFADQAEDVGYEDILKRLETKRQKGDIKGSFDRLIFVKDGEISLLKQNTAGATFAAAHRNPNIAQNGGDVNRNLLFQTEPSLLGVHNLSADNLRHTLKMGGLANPSLAVIDINIPGGFTEYGEISLLAPSPLIDKSTGRNAGTYGADIYSPRYPDITSEVTEEGTRTISDIFNAVEDENLKRSLIRALVEDIESGRKNTRSSGLQVAFALERGAEGITGGNYRDTVWNANEWIDRNELRRDFLEWAEGKYNSIEKDEKIFTGYTQSGKRRYIPHTLENVSRFMRQQELQGGESFSYGMGSTRAVIAPKFTNTKQIARNKERLTDRETFEAVKKELEEKYNKAVELLGDEYDYDIGEARLNEMFRSGRNPSEFAEEEYGIRLSEEDAGTLLELRQNLADMPTEYFETKFNRPVYLNEFLAAVVPEGMDGELKKALEEAGLRIHEYKNEDDRAAAVREFSRELSQTTRLLFQTEQELIDDAASFDSWQDFMEFYESFGKPEDNIVPADADAAWYQAMWELARQKKNTDGTQSERFTPEDNDRRFLQEIEAPGVLEDFLAETNRIVNTELWQPMDADEAAEVEAFGRLQDKIRTTLVHGSWLSNAQRIASGKELTPSTRQRLLTLVQNNVRDYRDLYARIMSREDLAVAEADTTAAQMRKRYRLNDPDNEIERRSPEQRRRIADELRNKEVAEKIRSGEMPMNDELQKYIDSLNREINTARREYERLKAETEEDYQRISDWETRELLRYYDRLLEAQQDYDNNTAEINRKIERGLRITQKLRKETDSRKASYDAIFSKFSALKRSMEITAEIQDALKRREDLHRLRTELNDRQKEKRLVEQEKKIRIQLVKRTMRKIRFDTVDYDKAKTIIAVQRLFEPNLLGGVNRWIGTEGPYLRSVYSRWNTDEDYRESLSAELRKTRGGRKAMEILDRTDTIEKYNSWTKKERETLHRAVPGEDWIKELGLEELAEEREKSIRLDIREETQTKRMTIDGKEETVTRTTAVPSDEIRELVKSSLGSDLYTQLVDRPFAEWTTEEMENFAGRINELYKEGRDELLAKNLVRRNQAAEIREAIEKAVKDTGIQINDDDPEDVKRKKQEKIDRILGNDSAVKGTVADKDTGFMSRINRMLHGYGDARVRSVTRILDGYRDGINTRELYVKENEVYNAKQRKITERTERINRAMRENGITLNELFGTVKVEDFYNGETVTFTVDELLFMREAAKDENSRAAVVYGNIGSSQQLLAEKAKLARDDADDPYRPGTQAYMELCEKIFRKVIRKADELDGKYLKFAEAIAEDYAEQYDRMNRVSIDEFNQPVNRVDNYVPLVRLESNGDTNENRVREDLLGINGMSRSGVDKGMTKSRIEIGPLHQKPVEMGLYRTWTESVERTEHFIAYAGYVRELNRVYRNRDAQYTRQFIENRYGRGMLQYIDDYIDETANPSAAGTQSELDRIVRTLRGRTAPAYLAWKMNSIIKQAATSPAPFFQFVSPFQYLAACFDIIKSKGSLYDSIKMKSPFMNNRVMDPINELVNEQAAKARNKADYALSNFNRLGMKGLEMVDWACVAPGWLACYRKKYAELEASKAERYEAVKMGLEERNRNLDFTDPDYMTAEEIESAAGRMLEEDTEKQAVDYADDCTRLSQPSSRTADIAPLFKSKGQGKEIAKAFLQFQTSLNVIWNNLRYDLPYAVRNKNFAQVAGIVGGYVFAGILVNMIVDGLPDDDDDKEKLKRLAWYGTTQFTDSIPVLGSAVTRMNEKLFTGRTSFATQGSDITPMVNKFIQAAQNASGGDWDKATTRAVEGFGLFTGLPVSGTKELMYVLSGEPGISALWGRRE